MVYIIRVKTVLSCPRFLQFTELHSLYSNISLLSILTGLLRTNLFVKGKTAEKVCKVV